MRPSVGIDGCMQEEGGDSRGADVLTRGLICPAVVMQWQCDASRELLAQTVPKQAVSSHPPSHSHISDWKTCNLEHTASSPRAYDANITS